MCRIFGFRSVLSSQVHTSLIEAENALVNQSERHPDGWGVAYYVAGAPHVIKSTSTALDDHIFKRVSGVVTSETVLAHLRKATLGTNSSINTHPFQFGRWVFAHNGNIKNFDKVKDELKNRITPKYRNFVLGDTDSELIFYLILTHLSQNVELHRQGIEVDDVASSVRSALKEIISIVGDYNPKDEGETHTYLTFVLTDGRTMIGFQGGKTLYYSRHKNQCSEKNICAHYAPECLNITKSGFVSHLIFSSEVLQGENVWNKMEPGQMVGIDWRMRIKVYEKF